MYHMDVSCDHVDVSCDHVDMSCDLAGLTSRTYHREPM